jgi:hypothetical protein
LAFHCSPSGLREVLVRRFGFRLDPRKAVFDHISDTTDAGEGATIEY